jgi:chemotaxis protein MotB
MVQALRAAPAVVPIIKRKKIIKGGGHHGGAWKVAYADFVTAMMAFFLLMWLLNATTEDQRKGIADYFNPTIPVSRISGGGSDALSGSSIFTEQTYAKEGTGASKKISITSEADAEAQKGKSGTQEEAEAEADALLQQEIESLQKALQVTGDDLSEHLQVRITPEGIVLEIVDSDGGVLFLVGDSKPSELLTTILGYVAESFSSIENEIKIVGHTDSRHYASRASYDNWNLSSDRAIAARKLLISSGFSNDQIIEVSGKADTMPLNPDPLAPENRRISITILK